MASEQVPQDDEFQEVDEDVDDGLELDDLQDYDDPTALDDDALDDADPAEEKDADPVGDEDAEEDDDASDEPDVPEEDVADEDDEDEEESLEALLTRGRDIDDSEIDSESRQGLTPVTPLVGAGEFTCRSCFLVKRRAQLADEERLICRDCM